MNDLFYMLGIAICAGVLLQMSMWITASLSQFKFNRQQLDASRELFKQQMRLVSQQRTASGVPEPGHWSGYREFYVDRLEKNVEMVTSVYLRPVDEKPIVSFKAGQYLSFRVQLPGEPKPVVRCYSLSTGPGRDYYRISVKAVAAPPGKPELPPGRVSNFINQKLMVGDKLEVKAPAGSFYLNDKGDSPIILMAGGVGITPMLSMIDDLVSKNSQRLIVLFYGVRCRREHAFKEDLEKIASQHSNIHVITCYSDPEPSDRDKIDYQVSGFVSVDLLKQLLPTNQCRFYLCGPPPFMESLRNGLLEWEVPENRINFEAFGPATIKKVAAKVGTGSVSCGSSSKISFSTSGKSLAWDPNCDSILDFAEARNIAIDSGCRAGSCQTCAVPLVDGEVDYPKGVEAGCESGECLPCIARPKGNIELGA